VNPLRFPKEDDYYIEILQHYTDFCNGRKSESIDLFVAREIIAILHELKDPAVQEPVENQRMWNIVKNSIILLLSLFRQHERAYFSNFCDLEEKEKNQIRKELFSISND
jgi:hypothetical protein